MNAAAVVDEVGEDPAAGAVVLDATRLREPEVSALADHPAPKLPAVDAHRVVRPILRIVVRLARRLHVGADSAVPEQIDRRLEDRRDQLLGRHLGHRRAERRLHLFGEFDPLERPREHATARRDQLAVVVVPRRTPETCEPFALDEGRLGIGIRVDEDVTVVERRDELDASRQQHAVPEYVPGHVADADDGDRIRLDVDIEFGEVAPARTPRHRGP